MYLLKSNINWVIVYINDNLCKDVYVRLLQRIYPTFCPACLIFVVSSGNFTQLLGVLMRELYQNDVQPHDGNASKILPRNTERLPEEVMRVVQLAASGCSSYEIPEVFGLTRPTIKNRTSATERHCKGLLRTFFL